MLEEYVIHNRFRDSGLEGFQQSDPHLRILSELRYQYMPHWWKELNFGIPGIYILTGGRQVGKSTSCKLLIEYCLKQKLFEPKQVFYLSCDEIYDAKTLSRVLRLFLDSVRSKNFLLIVDEITFVRNWDRVIKALADEGHFTKGLCLLTGSDTLILKEAAMSFPGRRGQASKVDFHLYPLCFSEYVKLIKRDKLPNIDELCQYFLDYLHCGGYLRAINDFSVHGKVLPATFMTYEQWIRGDFLKQGKSEDKLIAVLHGLLSVGVSQVSYSTLTNNIGLMSKDTLIEYCHLLERMDVLINLQAFDQNKKQGFPRKNRKFHFFDPFIYQAILSWVKREGFLNSLDNQSAIVEACVATHCYRYGKTFYFKGKGEVDIIWLYKKVIRSIEVKWSHTIRPSDLKLLKQFKDRLILNKNSVRGEVDGIKTQSVYEFLFELPDKE